MGKGKRPAYLPPLKQPGNTGPNAKLYNSSRWRKYAISIRRDATIARDGYGCEVCHHVNEMGTAEVTDHIIPVKQGGAVWDRRNLMALCHLHHNIKRGYESKGMPLAVLTGQDGLYPADRQQVYDIVLKRNR